MNEALSEELDRYNDAFAEGEWGRLDFELDRRPTDAEVLWVTGSTDGKAFHVKHWERDGRKLSISFQKGPLILALIPVALGLAGLGIVAWKLWKVPAEDVLGTVKQIAIPLGITALGAFTAYVGRDNWPVVLLGSAASAGGIYLGYLQLKPSPGDGDSLKGVDKPSLFVGSA